MGNLRSATTEPPQPKQVRQKKATYAHRSQTNPGLTQTMINSPGGIQAGGNVTIISEPRILNAISMRASIEVGTPPTNPGEPGTDAGLQSIIAIFAKDKTRIRFATNFTLQDQQVSETRRRLSFTYTPETPEDILGKPLAYLAAIEVLAVNYAEILRMKQIEVTESQATIQCVIAVNGIRVAEINMTVPPGVLAKGQATFNVSEAFARIPAEYEKAVTVK
jgi:hypothetical protein